MGELSQKLQEIEVAQPQQATANRVALATYRTYLRSLAKVQPS